MICSKCQKNEAREVLKSNGREMELMFDYCEKCSKQEEFWFRVWFTMMSITLLVYLWGLFKGFKYIISLLYGN